MWWCWWCWRRLQCDVSDGGCTGGYGSDSGDNGLIDEIGVVATARQ